MRSWFTAGVLTGVGLVVAGSLLLAELADAAAWAGVRR